MNGYTGSPHYPSIGVIDYSGTQRLVQYYTEDNQTHFVDMGGGISFNSEGGGKYHNNLNGGCNVARFTPLYDTAGTITVGGTNAAISLYTWKFDAVGNFTTPASVSAALYTGPATAPSGPCTAVGWVFSQDGHATFCNGSSWVSKI